LAVLLNEENAENNSENDPDATISEIGFLLFESLKSGDSAERINTMAWAFKEAHPEAWANSSPYEQWIFNSKVKQLAEDACLRENQARREMEQRHQETLGQIQAENSRPLVNGDLENLHTAIDLIGLAPFVGDVCDGVNAVIYLCEGNYTIGHLPRAIFYLYSNTITFAILYVKTSPHRGICWQIFTVTSITDCFT
jgi:hypothetical protein